MLKKLTTTAAILFAASAPAFAHVSPEHASGLVAGFVHPFTGLDHMLAMVSVGLWAGMTGGKAKFVVPAAFVSMMVAGFGLAVAGFALPFVEPAILASVIGLGLLVALAVRMPLSASAGVVAVFALFHGNAHGLEMQGANAIEFAAGFGLATLALHLSGLALAMVIGAGNTRLARVAGAGTALAGLALLLG